MSEYHPNLDGPAEPIGLAMQWNGDLAVRSTDWFGDFAACLQNRKAKLRAGCKMTINTETFVTTALPTIEIQLKPRKWLPLKMPDSRWYFDSAAERDEMLKRLMSPNSGKGQTRETSL